jgi:molecular chaperone GrpE
MTEKKIDTKDKVEKQPLEKPERDVENLENLLEEKEEEILSYIDRLKRLQAEFENYKKRTMREMASLQERVADQEILDFLPLYDNLQRAFADLSKSDDPDAFRQGIERIYAQFEQILIAKGVSQIESVGTSFDPNKHEALLSAPSDEDRNVILEEFERGYMRNGRVLRPCKVKVSSGKEEPDKEELK